MYEILCEGKTVQDIEVPDEFLPKMLLWQTSLHNMHSTALHEALQTIESVKPLTNREIGLNAAQSLSDADKRNIFLYRSRGEHDLSQRIWLDLKSKIKESSLGDSE